jgi:hypothetical protein
MIHQCPVCNGYWESDVYNPQQCARCGVSLTSTRVVSGMTLVHGRPQNVSRGGSFGFGGPDIGSLFLIFCWHVILPFTGIAVLIALVGDHHGTFGLIMEIVGCLILISIPTLMIRYFLFVRPRIKLVQKEQCEIKRKEFVQNRARQREREAQIHGIEQNFSKKWNQNPSHDEVRAYACDKMMQGENWL